VIENELNTTYYIVNGCFPAVYLLVFSTKTVKLRY